MSYASENCLPQGTRVDDVREFVRLLGYQREGSLREEKVGRFEFYRFFEEKDYRSWGGVSLCIQIDGPKISVNTTTAAGRSFYDLEMQNVTISGLKKWFGGTFETDEGKNRYLRTRSKPPPPAASGCYLAFHRYGGNLIKSIAYLTSRRFPKQENEELVRRLGMLQENLSNNLLIPFLVAALEDYFKSAFVAILRHSDRKAAVFRNLRLQGDHLVAVSDGKAVEEQIAEVLSFQRVSAVSRNFELLDPKLDVAGTLKKPFRRRKQSLFDQLEQVVTIRHDVIHRAKIDTKLTDSRLHDLIYDLDEAVSRVDRHLTAHYKWPLFQRSWFLGNRRLAKQDWKEALEPAQGTGELAEN